MSESRRKVKVVRKTPAKKPTKNVKEVKMETEAHEVDLGQDPIEDESIDQEIGETIPRSNTHNPIVQSDMEISDQSKFDFLISTNVNIEEDNEILKLFICKDHYRGEGGGSPPSTIIVAKNEKEAIEILNIQLSMNGFETYNIHPFTFQMYPLFKSRSFILSGTPFNEITQGMDMASTQFTPSSNPSLFVCTDHWSQWPVPPVSIVIADNEDHARNLLDQELQIRSMKTGMELPYTFESYDLVKPFAIIIDLGQPGGIMNTV